MYYDWGKDSLRKTWIEQSLKAQLIGPHQKTSFKVIKKSSQGMAEVIYSTTLKKGCIKHIWKILYWFLITIKANE